MTKYDKDYFKEKFPNLTKEINNKSKTVKIDGIRTDSEESEKAAKPDRESGPTAVDFIRLCDSEEEAVEIINYLESEEKIPPEYAKKLRNQLTHKGLRSFGSKRTAGEYSSTE